MWHLVILLAHAAVILRYLVLIGGVALALVGYWWLLRLIGRFCRFGSE